MPRIEDDEVSSAALHMDVVHEVPEDAPVPVTRWVEVMRPLNSIQDPLGRRLVRLHRNCGSGNGVCDAIDGHFVAITQRSDWGCETTEIFASHFGIEYPKRPPR